jgi:hypothetical protein
VNLFFWDLITRLFYSFYKYNEAVRRDSTSKGFQLDIEEDYLIRRISHERSNPETTTKNSISNSKSNSVQFLSTLNEEMLSEGFGESKKRDFIDDDEKEEILLDNFGSEGTSGVSAEAYPRLSTQDYQNVALLVVLCK